MENMSKIIQINQDQLKEKGRLQYFYHSPSSELPIRDVLNEQKQGHKTEPHIEIGAENYWYACYQSNNIIPFLKSDEKYLLLFTTCKNKTLTEFYGKKYIVGYIEKQTMGESPKHQKSSCQKTGVKSKRFVKGNTFLFNFSDSISLNVLGFSKFTRVKKTNLAMTEKILDHFKGKENILKECVNEIKRLDSNNNTCFREKYGYPCQFEDECLRWKN